MKTIKETSDGSLTLYSEKFDQYYHSIFGANEESLTVYIELGLEYALHQFGDVRLFEMGFGTGLNAAMTLEFLKNRKENVSYLGLEAFPLSTEDYPNLASSQQVFQELGWDIEYDISSNFKFEKTKGDLLTFETDRKFNLVYYDAFAPVSQPELWTEEAFEKIANLLEPGGVLTTYCSKSYVQRNMRATGFTVSKHPGPRRKREILRAVKA